MKEKAILPYNSSEGKISHLKSKKMHIMMASTSYPRSRDDWQGLFIKKIADNLASNVLVQISMWSPHGPMHQSIKYGCSNEDRIWLDGIANRGGIANILRNDKITAIKTAATLILKLRRYYKSRAISTDIYHINWLQNALPLYGIGKPAVISVLGTDLKLLKVPGMVTALRAAFKGNRVVLTPNANWMVDTLAKYFSDIVDIQAVPFGIDEDWYNIRRRPQTLPRKWLCVLRVTKTKMGALFDWGEDFFDNRENELHLFGPLQEDVRIPKWVNYHGPTTPKELISDWAPNASGFITLSQHSEGRPQIILESMASGLPIIASDIKAHTDFVKHNEHGHIVKSRDQLIAALSWLSDPAVNNEIGENARNYVAREFGTWQDCTSRYMKLYQRLLK